MKTSPQSTPSTRNANESAPSLPESGIKKANPKEVERNLDEALEQSMDASDPPAVIQPDVKVHRKDKPKTH